MSEFLHKHNTDNVHTRAVIVGLINLLNSRIQYENVLSNTETEIIDVPFIPNMGGDERFLQDFYTHWNDCQHPRMADGNYDIIPRGVVTLTSNSINTSSMTHRFVRGSYVKEVKGELQRYSAFLNSIPLTLEFEIEVKTDTLLDAFKIQQAILETFYKVQVFSVNFKGFRVPCQAGFSDDQNFEKTFDYTYQDQTDIKISFSITVETYYPVTDPTTERLDSNRMTKIGQDTQGIGFKVYTKDEKDSSYYIEMKSPIANDIYFSSGILPISWLNTGTITSISIYYQTEKNPEWIPIIKHIKNTGSYYWNIPFFDKNGIEISKDNISASVISTTGVSSNIRAIIDESGSVENIIIFQGGYGYTNLDYIEVSSNETLDDEIKPVIQATVDNNGIIIGSTIVSPGGGYTPTPVNRLKIKIVDDFNNDVFDMISKSTNFTGDIDNTTIEEDTYYITNIKPSLYELQENSEVVVGMNVEGLGIIQNTYIESIDVLTNKIKLSNPVTLKRSDTLFKLPLSESTITIK